ncbi:MAG TPA: hypothetical protein PKK06_01860 [Phycisphaerae bacterium]|nr:hypothetical protein [Phycisphaerae bacterium]HNU44130.1 hypothetical protein [Phycisphaerae bacterium]
MYASRMAGKSSVLWIVVALGSAAGVSAPARAEHQGDVWVGRTAGGQLALTPSGYVPEENYRVLPPVSGLLHGWADDDPGFDALQTPEPQNNVYPLQAGCAIRLEVVACDPAFRAIDAAYQILDEPGESTYLGGSSLHVHLTWHVNSDDPLYDPTQCVWQATFILRDTGSTHYTPSAPFTFSFTNVDLSFDAGDYDDDGDVDLTDYAAFEDCLAGPDTPPQPAAGTCEAELRCLVSFDLDDDEDVDLADFAQFAALFTD